MATKSFKLVPVISYSTLPNEMQERLQEHTEAGSGSYKPIYRTNITNKWTAEDLKDIYREVFSGVPLEHDMVLVVFDW